MTYLAYVAAARFNGVSRLHGASAGTSSGSLYPRWPERTFPWTRHQRSAPCLPGIRAWADRLWTTRGRKRSAARTLETLSEAIQAVPTRNCGPVVPPVRHALGFTMRASGWPDNSASAARRRRSWRRLHKSWIPTSSLWASLGGLRPTSARPAAPRPGSLVRLLKNGRRAAGADSAAGKPHPGGRRGEALGGGLGSLVRQPPCATGRLLEDYDITLVRNWCRGWTVWLNTPRRPWEACGTSGMKVLVKRGPELLGAGRLVAEAYTPDVGWALAMA